MAMQADRRKSQWMLMLALLALASCANPTRDLETLAPALLPIDGSEAIEKKVAPVTLDQMLSELQRSVNDNPPDFSLGKGDILSVSVYDEPDLSLESIPVRPDGKISFPLIGDVNVAGRTVDEVRKDITEGLRRYLLQPRVAVVVKEFRSIEYTVYGEVAKPGVYPLTTEVSITEAIARAGGLAKGSFRSSSVELADLEGAFIARNGKILPVDFVRLIRGGDLRFDINIYPGDFINIPSGLSQETYVLGEVNKPALFAHRENMPMSRIIAMSEGFTKDADLSRIHIMRGSLSNPMVIVSDFTRVVNGEAQDVRMEPGDVVYVPPTRLSAYARTLDKLIPTIQALQIGIILSGAVQ
jgi:polysaccharide export outer membrane protein